MTTIHRRPLYHHYGCIHTDAANKWMTCNNNIFESGFWTYGNVLNEKLHIFEGDAESEYRKAIRYMVASICEAENYINQEPSVRRLMKRPAIIPKYVKLKENKYYSRYEFYKPFEEVDGLDIINKIKVYFKEVEPEDEQVTYIVCSNLGVSEYYPEQLPMFKSDPNNSKIDVISIVSEELTDELTLYNVFAHELKHALFAVKSQKRQLYAEYSSGISELLMKESKAIKQTSRNVPTVFGWSMANVYFVFSNLEYFCSTSEIESHLESVIAEIKNKFVDHSKKRLLDAITRPEDSQQNSISYVSQTLQNYRELYQYLTVLCDNRKMSMFKKHNRTEYDNILNILCRFNVGEDDNLFDMVQHYKAQVQKFLKNAADIIINTETPQEKEIRLKQKAKQKRFKQLAKK